MSTRNTPIIEYLEALEKIIFRNFIYYFNFILENKIYTYIFVQTFN